jgi:hypothetical protein
MLRAFWLPQNTTQNWKLSSLRELISKRSIQIKITPWSIFVLSAVLLVLFFRFYNLDQVPPEMVSDHAEKYIDVRDILQGQTKIFFPRNGGREALQFYMLAGANLFLKAPLNHLLLKISTVIIGLLALPFIYLLGKEIDDKRTGLLAFLFAGISYWTNVVSRSGMRLPFYILFTAAALFFLIRGIRTSSRNHFILSGLILGLSFYGYSANRLLPIVILTAVLLFILHKQSIGNRSQALFQFSILILMSFIVFLPLMRFIVEYPTDFSYRMFSRIGSIEQPLIGTPISIFFSNTWNALKMFSWSNGVVWPVSIPEHPALGIVSGGFFYIGVLIVVIRYFKYNNWLDLFLIVSIPLLMLPSILALAFPSENPSLYRTGGAAVPVFLLVGIAVNSLMSNLEGQIGQPWGSKVAAVLVLVIIVWSTVLNYDLIFNKFYLQYRNSAWNTSEMGEIIRGFAKSSGNINNAWLMGFPHWADSRLVAIKAGYPGEDIAMFPENLKDTQEIQGKKLFLINPQDQKAIESLKEQYPQGLIEFYESFAEDKSFLIFTVPPNE